MHYDEKWLYDAVFGVFSLTFNGVCAIMTLKKAVKNMRKFKTNNKIKSLQVLKYLVTSTNIDSPATATKIIDYLGTLGIQAQRSCIYRDINTFRRLGLTISKKGHGFYYEPKERDYIYEITNGLS